MTRVAMVTGASSGIGKEFGAVLAARGWQIVLVGRDEGRLVEVGSGWIGGPHTVLLCDLATDQGIVTATDRLRATEMPISLLIAAAGMGTSAPFPGATLDEELLMLNVNVRAVLALTHVAARAMAARGDGAIVTVASTAAYWSTGTYAASKSWVLHATLGLHDQLRDSGVRVLAVCPGFTRTQFHRRSQTDASGVKSWLWLDPATVVRQSLAALDDGRAVCIPGRRYRALVEGVRHLPPGGRSRVLRYLAPLAGANFNDSARDPEHEGP